MIVKTPNPMRAGRLQCVGFDQTSNELEISTGAIAVVSKPKDEPGMGPLRLNNP